MASAVELKILELKFCCEVTQKWRKDECWSAWPGSMHMPSCLAGLLDQQWTAAAAGGWAPWNIYFQLSWSSSQHPSWMDKVWMKPPTNWTIQKNYPIYSDWLIGRYEKLYYLVIKDYDSPYAENLSTCISWDRTEAFWVVQLLVMYTYPIFPSWTAVLVGKIPRWKLHRLWPRSRGV